jgi:hypothetical protein
MKGAFAPKRARLLGGLVLLVAFGAGTLSGAAFDRLLSVNEPVLRTVKNVAREEQRRPPQDPPRDVFDQIGVTAEQRVAIDAILERRVTESEALWAEYRPKADAIVDGARAEIQALLTDEQIAKYTELRSLRRGRGPGGPNGPDRYGPPGPDRFGPPGPGGRRNGDGDRRDDRP